MDDQRSSASGETAPDALQQLGPRLRGELLDTGLGCEVGQVLIGGERDVEAPAGGRRLLEQWGRAHVPPQVVDEIRVLGRWVDAVNTDGSPVVLDVPPEPAR